MTLNSRFRTRKLKTKIECIRKLFDTEKAKSHQIFARAKPCQVIIENVRTINALGRTDSDGHWMMAYKTNDINEKRANPCEHPTEADD